MPPRIYHISPPLGCEYLEYNDTSNAEPTSSELSNSAWIEVQEKEWTDEQLKDDARPGRRKGKLDHITDAPESVSDDERQRFEQGLRRRGSDDSEEWEFVEVGELRGTIEQVLGVGSVTSRSLGGVLAC
jgi:hypothetical protein